MNKAKSGSKLLEHGFPRRYLGPFAIVAYTLLTIVVWSSQGIEESPVPVPAAEYLTKKASEMLASVAMVLMGFALILAARFRFLEDYFGGLDRMYHVHKILGVLSMLLLIAHFASIPELSDEANIGKPLGIVSLVGFAVLTLLTIIRKFPYHRWFPSHRLMGVFYIVGIAHTMLADNMIVEGSLLSVLMRGIAFIAAACYLYKELYRERFGPRFDFVVARLRPLKDAVELQLTPVDRRFDFRAGQFAFLSVHNGRTPRESHPFTIASGPDEAGLRFTIKALGDYTSDMTESVRVGDPVRVDGPFGRFTLHDAPDPQIWVAGGIGVTPFLSALRDPQIRNRRIDFFYSVRSRADALFLDEIQKRANEIPNFQFHLRLSDQEPVLTAQTIAGLIDGPFSERTLFLCGPVSMVRALTKQAKALGMPGASIHYEKFAIR